MATAIIPILTSLGPEIISLITGLVHKSAPAAEAQFGSGTGPVKLAQVLSDVNSALSKAAAAGTIPQTVLNDPNIQTIVSAVIASLQLEGSLSAQPSSAGSPPTTVTLPGAVTPAAQAITLTKGQSLTITIV